MTIPSFLADLDFTHLVNATSMLAEADAPPGLLLSVAYGFCVWAAMACMCQNGEAKKSLWQYALGLAIFDAILPNTDDADALYLVIMLVQAVVEFFVIKAAMKCSVGRAIGTWLLLTGFALVCALVLLGLSS